jgi:transposase
MDTHKNAPLTPKGRVAMARSVVEGELSKPAAAGQFNTTPKSVAKLVTRFCAEGVDGLRDRSSRPHSLPSQTPAAACAAVEALRRQRYAGKQIAIEVGVSAAAVSRILRRLGLNRLAALEPAKPFRRYEREHTGELIHLEIKKLGRIGSVGHRITGRYPSAVNRRHGIGWELSTFALMMLRASPSSRSWPISARKVLWLILRPLSLTLPGSEFASSA